MSWARFLVNGEAAYPRRGPGPKILSAQGAAKARARLAQLPHRRETGTGRITLSLDVRWYGMTAGNAASCAGVGPEPECSVAIGPVGVPGSTPNSWQCLMQFQSNIVMATHNTAAYGSYGVPSNLSSKPLQQVRSCLRPCPEQTCSLTQASIKKLRLPQKELW